jgi:hypothetical protein
MRRNGELLGAVAEDDVASACHNGRSTIIVQA